MDAQGGAVHFSGSSSSAGLINGDQICGQGAHGEVWLVAGELECLLHGPNFVFFQLC